MIEMDAFKVILLGVAPDSDRATACSNLAKAFRTTPEKIEDMLSKCPITIKTNIDHRTALGYMDIIQTNGGQCKMAEERTGGPGKESQLEASTVLKTCANCGYSATTAEDPLLTAYDGKGECPACGTIAAKLAVNQESVAEPDPVNTDTQEDDDTPSALMSTVGSLLSRPWTALFVVLAAIGIVYGFLQDSSPKKNKKDVALTEKTASAPAKPPSPKSATRQPDIYPGETREVAVTMYLPYLHLASYFPITITPKVSVSHGWEDDGLSVFIMDTSISNETVTLWERRREGDNHWVPEAGCRIYSELAINKRIEKGKDFLHAESGAKVALEPEPNMKITEGDPDQRQNEYTVYRADILLSVSVSSSGQFNAREPVSTRPDGKTGARDWRTATLTVNLFAELHLDGNLIKATSVNNWQPGKMLSLSPHQSFIKMTHKSGQEGIFLHPRDKYPGISSYCHLEIK